MQGNNLDNVVVPRDVLIYEGLLGLLPNPRAAANELKWRKKGKWAKAVACYQTNELLARKIWDTTWRLSYELDILTLLGPEFAEALEHRLKEVEGLPVKRVWSEDPYLLMRRVMYEPNIRFFYDPDPRHIFAYGSKGRIMGPDDIHMLGA